MNQAESQPQTKNTPAGIRRRLLPLAALALVAAAGWLLLGRSATVTAADAPARPPVPVETVAVLRQPAVRQVQAVGTLQSNESVVLAAEITGRIAAISFAEGTAVTQGQVLLKLDDSVPRAQLDQAEANLALHQADYRRAVALLEDRAVSERERDQAYAQWQLDEASVRLARAQLAKTELRAPFAGTIGLRRVSIGDYVQPGQPLVNLEDNARLKVEFQLPELNAPLVRAGQALRLRSDAYPGEDFAAEVYAINPLVDAASRSLVLRGWLDNRDGRLNPGQFVRVTLELGRQEDALFIPEQAVVPHPERPYVWKVVDSRATMARVDLGQRGAGLVQVVSGLSAGELVITGGIQKVGQGAAVKAVPADPGLFAPAAPKARGNLER